MDQLNVNQLNESSSRYDLKECLGTGIYGKVYRAIDNKEGQKVVAIKAVSLNEENLEFIQEEYTVLKTFSSNPNLPDFYDVCKSSKNGAEEIWFVMEICEGGPVIDLVNGLRANNRGIPEEHIAYILKQVVKALLYLHDNGVMHRDVKGSNILLTGDGEVKLVDFGLSRCLNSNMAKSGTFIGSPSWIAPEVINSYSEVDVTGYDIRSDVWSLGITALELANGKAPYEDMHPTRALFQIVRNPPPSLDFSANWSEEFIDFINECLIKIPEHRPYMAELIEHPFLTQIPDNDYHFTQELKVLNQQFNKFGKDSRRAEVIVQSNLLKCGKDAPLEKMHLEDLAALPKINEATILQELAERVAMGQFYTFVGDVLLFLNTSEHPDVYGEEEHHRYQFKSRSDNAPHIYAVADAAYQAVLHHQTPQNIVLSGESASGKTRNYLHLIDHLLYLGRNTNINQERIKDAMKLIHAFTHASTPTNDYSTRCIIRTEITFGETGKNTGAIFEVYQMDNWRVSSTDMSQANYHILYYFYDGLHEMGLLEKYRLNKNRAYRYLRIPTSSKSSRPRDNPKQNVKKFQKIQEMFREFQFTDDETEMVFNTLAAIINLGDVRFTESAETDTEIENRECVVKTAQLLKVSEKKLAWSLINYCVVEEDDIVPQRHTCDQARDARDSLANTLYCRTVQFVVWVINQRLSIGRSLFGEKHSIKVLDMYGFECFKYNHFPQFLINCFNEELQYHYVQRLFGWEAIELHEEEVPFTALRYYNNHDALEEMLGKSGVLPLIDEASKLGKSAQYITRRLQSESRVYINKVNGTEFCINHYTGKVTYDCKEMPNRNREYLPPELLQTMRGSSNEIIKSLFVNNIDKTGNVYFSPVEPDSRVVTFAQTKKVRTTAASFKALSLKLLQELSVGGGTGGTHFVRCIRSDLQNNSKGFFKQIIKQQLKAMSILETAEARQFGFPYRISFSEFLRRYKFLAFDFNENVEVTKENCRLLLIRLKMEGWAIGKTKVLLQYYNEEYLSRLYETHVKKIIKIQSMIRSYLAKRRTNKRIKDGSKVQRAHSTEINGLTQDEAATVVQRAYKSYARRKDPLGGSKQSNLFDEDLSNFIRAFYTKWKAKTIFQVLLQYRAARHLDLYNFSQQVHLFNQNVVNMVQKNGRINLDRVERRACVSLWLGSARQPVLKVPFRIDDIPYFDTSHMCPSSIFAENDRTEEAWDAPLHWRENEASLVTSHQFGAYTPTSKQRYQTEVLEVPFTRSPSQQVRYVPSPTISLSGEKRDEIVELYRPTTPVLSLSAHNDFEYISLPKQQPIKVKDFSPNPITELEMRGIRSSVDSEDDPPFNFQAMLRKTNLRKDYDRREEVVLEKPALKITPPKNRNIEEPKVLKNYENVCLKNSQNKAETDRMKIKENETQVYNKSSIKVESNNMDTTDDSDKLKTGLTVSIVDTCDSVTTNEVDAGVFLEGLEIPV